MWQGINEKGEGIGAGGGRYVTQDAESGDNLGGWRHAGEVRAPTGSKQGREVASLMLLASPSRNTMHSIRGNKQAQAIGHGPLMEESSQGVEPQGGELSSTSDTSTPGELWPVSFPPARAYVCGSRRTRLLEFF